MKKTIWTTALVAASFIAAPAAQASTVSTGWVRNPAITRAICLSLGEQIGPETGLDATSNGVSTTLRNDEGDLVVLVCDAAPYIFFLAVHDTKPAAEVEAIADMIEARIMARVNALP